MELLRLASMFLVLVIHANTAFDPWPIDHLTVVDNPLTSSIRLIIESLSVVCVNAFILLSGWFGIKFSFKRLFAFIFQVYFFSLVLAVVLPNGREQLGGKLLFDIFTLEQYWFVRAYIILFILSPALNLFAEKAPKDVFRNVLIAFFTMETIFAYISNSNWFDDGFSPIPFIGLYLLARFIRIHKPGFSTLKRWTDLCIYIGVSLLITVLSLFLLGRFSTGGRMFNYTNPLVIVSSVYFVLIFSKMQIKESPVLNWIALSSVGAYLLHMNPLFLQPYYIKTLQSFQGLSPALLTGLSTIAYMLAVFMAGVLLDKIRQLVWNGILTAFKAR